MVPRFHPTRTVPLLLAAAASFAGGQTVAPADALDWADPALLEAHELVDRIEAEVSAGSAPSLRGSVDPRLRFRDYPGDGAAGEWSATLGFGATLDLGDPADTRIRSLQRLERARHAARAFERDSVRDALLAHANLLVAQERVRTARADLEETRLELADSNDPMDRLDLRFARLELAEREFQLDEARERARSFGLEGEAAYEPLRFELRAGGVDPSDTHDYRLLHLRWLEAKAELAEAQRGALDDLRLRAGYRSREVQFDVQGGLINGEPGATFGIDLPGGTERWEVELSAQLWLADERLEIERLETELDAAREELEAYPGRFIREQESALVEARLAEEGLQLAEEEWVLAGDSAAGRLYRAWIAYLRAVARLLELNEGEWRPAASH